MVPSQSKAVTHTTTAGLADLTYHGGPVIHTNTTYAVYWIPAGYQVSLNYQNLINGYLQNVVAASGQPRTVYASDTQYYDTLTGNILDQSVFGGAVVDTTPFPPNGCTDRLTSICLTDAQIQQEITTVLAHASWTPDLTHLFFLFTPQNVGSCAEEFCAYTDYCAYHGSFGSGSAVTLYANQPYAAFIGECDAGQRPNGDDADATINVLSHEHNEAITAPTGEAWYDAAQEENGDKCAWTFGTPLGSTGVSPNSAYNQVIGTGKYYLQQEWSNASSSCVLTYGASPPGSTASVSPSSLSFGSQAVGTTSAPQIVWLTASGSTPVAISAIVTTGDFVQINTCPSTLQLLFSCAIGVRFAPAAVGPRTGALTIIDNARGSPQTVALSGSGT